LVFESNIVIRSQNWPTTVAGFDQIMSAIFLVESMYVWLLKGLFRFKPLPTLWFSEQVTVILTQHYIKGFTNRFFNIALVNKKSFKHFTQKTHSWQNCIQCWLMNWTWEYFRFFFMLTKARKHKRIIAFRYSGWFWLTLNFGFWNLRSCVLFVLEFCKRKWFFVKKVFDFFPAMLG